MADIFQRNITRVSRNIIAAVGVCIRPNRVNLVRRLLCCATLYLGSTLVVASDDYIRELEEPFDCDKTVGSEPAKVFEQMQAMDETGLSPVQLAQKNYCSASAMLMLTYPGQAVEFIEVALSHISEQSQPWLFHVIQILNSQAAEMSGEPSQALELINPTLTWAINNNDKSMEMSALQHRGLSKIGLGDYLGALQDLNLAYSMADEDNDEAKVSIGSYLAMVYEYRDEFDLAIPYFQQAVNYYRGTGNALNLSVALYGLGYAFAKQGKYSLAQETLHESLRKAQSIDDEQGVAYAKKELAYINIQNSNFALAEKQLTEAQVSAEKSDNPFLTMGVNRNLAALYLAIGNIGAAEQANEQARALVDMTDMPVDYLELEKQKASLSAARGYYKAAYETILHVLDEKLVLMREQSANQLLQIRAQYELQTKEKENQLLQEINSEAEAELQTQRSHNVNLLLLLATAGIICILLAYITIRNQEVKRKLQQMADLDGLTGVPNRRRTMELIGNQLSLARRHNYPLSVGIIDLDNFKSINDNFGHPTGDRVLEAFGLVLRQNMRATDIIGRIGGEEFIVALPHTDTETAYTVIDQLRLKAHKVPALIEDYRFDVSFSCGLCDGAAMKDMSELMARADSALYVAKHSGRDRIAMSGSGNYRRQTMPEAG